MKKTIIILLIISIAGCSKNVWISQSAVRPKKPNYSILKEPFVGSRLINNTYLYVSKKKFVYGLINNYMYDFTGFYPNGKMIGFSINGSELSFINSNNSWQTAQNVGYYTTNGNKIKYQYFVPYGGGQYETKEGIIKQDTIILNDKVNFITRSEIRYDTLIESSYRIR